MRIRVLWIDDEYVKQSDVISDAEQDDIDLIPFESHEEGIRALNADKTGFHAIILDAKVKNKQSDTTTSLKGLAASRDKLIQLNSSGYFIPYFIFTGQPGYESDENFKDSYGDFFIKGKDNQKLFDAIKEAVINKEEFIIHSDFKNVFDVCNKHFDVDTKKCLTKILLSIKKPSQIFDDELYFTHIRIILENLFREANKHGLLHDKCLAGGKVNLTESSLFLAGEPTKHLGAGCKQNLFPKLIANFVRDIIFITGAASHTTDANVKNNIDLQEYRALINTPYLLYSLTFQLMDVLIWFDSYLANNNDYEVNKSLWIAEEVAGDLISGLVLSIDSQRGFGFFKPDGIGSNAYISAKLVNNHSLQLNMPIIVQIDEYTDNKTGELKKSVNKIIPT